jgi:hypothetical protein
METTGEALQEALQQFQCRDYYSEDAEIWESNVLKCSHCFKRWLAVHLARQTTFECPHCEQITRKRVVRSFSCESPFI